MRRRDMCYFIGLRAAKLSPPEAAEAWSVLARHLDSLGEKDIPKFLDLLAGIRAATIRGKQRQKARAASALECGGKSSPPPLSHP